MQIKLEGENFRVVGDTLAEKTTVLDFWVRGYRGTLSHDDLQFLATRMTPIGTVDIVNSDGYDNLFLLASKVSVGL